VQEVQFAFIVQCRDETLTRHGVQRFFDWLNRSGESNPLIEWPVTQARFVAANADEVGE